ncbi:ATP-binding protein [Tumebacillus flagellatus]|uniref:IstB-like ATP-binding domain-containing protein n=1 Tax=Tumebacillus flagellatus TaxID=1157490 RepID=A0A074LI70_9BACL|nr:ATP-binding protein [Tumebacillus flagellatus]KEO80839.1 hypothetical protein EL26_24140 [Tumebacillus flagellatus]
MEHIGEIEKPTSNFARARTIQLLRERLPKLADVTDAEINRYGGDLLDAANCLDRCRNCTGYAECWREELVKGYVTKYDVADGKIKLQQGVKCKPHLAHEAREQQERMLRVSGMTDKERGFTFDNFPVEQARRHRSILERATDLADGDGSGTGIYFYGPPGIAKTHLMLAVLNRLNDRGILAVFVRADRMIDKLREAIKNDCEEDVLERYMTCPVLGIDELAQEPRLKEYGLECMIKILNYRAAAKLLTLFTSNFEPYRAYEQHYEKFPEQIDALRSRVALLSIPARMTGEDWRLNSYSEQLGPDEEV